MSTAAATQPVGDPKPLCEHCPVVKRDEWRARWARIRSEVQRHDLTLLELQMMNFLVDHTYGWGRRVLIVPLLNLLPTLVRMDDTAVGRTLKRLHGRRMIYCVQKKKGELHFSINENVGIWGAAKHDADETIQANLNRLRMYNGLPAAHIEQDAALNFNDGPLAKILGAVVDDSSIDKSTEGSIPNFADLPWKL